jgi:hypothetical protein
MFLGISLTTWMILLGVFAIMTPIVGKQVAKDSLRVKDALIIEDELKPFLLFPTDMLNGTVARGTSPIQKLTEKQYIERMMWGGVWLKFLFNVGAYIFLLAMLVVGSIIYSVEAFFRGICSTK